MTSVEINCTDVQKLLTMSSNAVICFPMSRQYKYVKQGILSGEIDTWEGVFELYSISWLAKDLHMRVETLRTKSKDVARFEYGEVLLLAQLFGIAFSEMDAFVRKTASNPDFRK